MPKYLSLFRAMTVMGSGIFSLLRSRELAEESPHLLHAKRHFAAALFSRVGEDVKGAVWTSFHLGSSDAWPGWAIVSARKATARMERGFMLGMSGKC